MIVPPQKITTALVLAAGMGRRLSPLTQVHPKCLTRVNGMPILGRLTSGLAAHGFRRLIVVTGHLDHCIRQYLKTASQGLETTFIHADQYETTNNICSLWAARHALDDPFVLVESDLVFDPALIPKMQVPDRVAVARLKPWMDGTLVTLGPLGTVDRFLTSHDPVPDAALYKTVNIYSFSANTWRLVKAAIGSAVAAGNTQAYYESVFKGLVEKKALALDPVFFDHRPWYEIDTLEDLARAEKLFLDQAPAPAWFAPETQDPEPRDLRRKYDRP